MSKQHNDVTLSFLRSQPYFHRSNRETLASADPAKQRSCDKSMTELNECVRRQEVKRRDAPDVENFNIYLDF